MTERTKTQIRATAKRWRSGLDDACLAAASLAIAERLFVLPAYRAASTVCLFAPLAQEVRLDAVVTNCRQQGKRILLPAYRGAGEGYGFKEWADGRALRSGYREISEPDTDDFAVMDGTVLMVVPGLAFDGTGGRVGYGGGYYDRLLEVGSVTDRLTAVGVCLDTQVYASLPQDAWDRKMDFVVTETRVMSITSELQTTPSKGGRTVVSGLDGR